MKTSENCDFSRLEDGFVQKTGAFSGGWSPNSLLGGTMEFFDPMKDFAVLNNRITMEASSGEISIIAISTLHWSPFPLY
jgi:hypothetical protein